MTMVIMKTIAAAKFKAQCLHLMEAVSTTREAVVITKRGRPIAKLVPADSPSEQFLGRLKGVIKIAGDVEAPVEPPESWEVLR
jgi:prevent-host-death family protein